MTVRAVPCHAGSRREVGGDLAEAERAEGGEHEEDADEEAEVADAVDDEGLLAGVGGGVALEPEADEQVGGEADAFPADEHEEEVAGEDQDGHKKEEEIEEAEVARVAGVVAHVADGVDVDEEADAGDDEKHDQRELVEDKGEIDVECADGEPGIRKSLRKGKGERGDLPATRTTGRSGDHGHCSRAQHQCEGGQWREHADDCGEASRPPGAEDSVEQEAQERKQRDQPKMGRLVHSFIRSIRSTDNVARARKTAMMMARPTAASAAATIMTKKTKIWPRTSCHW